MVSWNASQENVANETPDDIFTYLTGRSTLLELKAKLLLDKHKIDIKETTPRLKSILDIIYDKFEKHLEKRDKDVLEEAK